MNADTILSRLDKVRRTGPGTWQARCPAHADKGPSLSVRELDDGRVLAHCFAGCAVEEVLTAVGLTFDDLFPPKPPPVEGRRPERRPFIPADAFTTIRHEATIVFLIGCDLHKNKAISEEDYQRLLTATSNLQNIGEVAYGR